MALQIRKRHLKLKQMAPKKIWVLIYIYFVSIILIQAQIKSDKTISEIISDAQNIHSNNVLESNFKIISKKILYSSFEFENFEGKNNDSTNRKFFEISLVNLIFLKNEFLMIKSCNFNRTSYPK